MALDIFKEFATDEASEREGVWVPLGDSKFKIARSNTKKYSQLLLSLFDEHRIELDKKDEAADKLSNDLMNRVLAETILLDWENVEYKGKALKYSVENAKTVLQHRDFRNWVQGQADNVANYKAKLLEEQSGN